MKQHAAISSRFSLAVILALLAGTSALPAETLPPTPPGALIALGPNGAAREMPLRHTDVTVEISGFVARTLVEQIFDNPFEEPIEVRYVFPLGDDAAVDAFEMQIDSRIVRGEIHRREEAREIYEEALEQGFQAALLDQEQPNVFSQRIANIAPGHPVIVRIQTVEILEPTAGVYEYVFPLVVAPRYVPEETATSPWLDGIPIADAPPNDGEPSGMRSGSDVAIRIWLHAGVTLQEVSSPSHLIVTARGDRQAAMVELAADDRIPNKDFVLRWQVGSDEPALGALAHRDGVDGYFALLLQPKGEVAVEESAPKQIVFLLDVSGSMTGPRLRAAKAFLGRAVEQLGPDDTFSLLTFESSTHRWRAEAVPTDPQTIREAKRWIGNRKTKGGTELLKGLQVAARAAQDPDRYSMIVAVTDALVGDDDRILASLRETLGETRLFTVGMGVAPNRSLIHRMARFGRGSFTYIPDDSRAEQALDRFFNWAGRPYLTDLEVDWGALPVLDTIPERLPDLFNGQTLRLVGRYTGSGSGEVTVRGRLGGTHWEQSLAVDLPDAAPEHAALASVWARERIEELTSIRPGNPTDDVREEIVELALEHRLMTEYTSFVAVDYTRVVNPSRQPACIDQAVAAPEDFAWPAEAGPGVVERVMVASLAPMVDRTSSYTSSRFSDAYIQDLPVPGRFYQNVLTLAPGIQDADRNGTPNVHGSHGRDFRAIVSGVGSVDPIVGQMMTNFNPNSIEEMEIISAGAGVEFSRAQGGFAKILQKQGTNELEGTFDLRLRDDLLDGHGAEHGAAAPRPDFDGQQAEFQLTGPIAKDRLWYRISHAGIDRHDPVATLKSLDLSLTRGRSFSEQLTWQVSPRNKLTLRLDGSRQVLGNADVSSMVREGVASRLEHDRDTYALTWTAPVSPRLLFVSTLAYDVSSFERAAAEREPAGCAFGSVSGQCLDLSLGETSGSISRGYDDRKRTLGLTSTATLFGGNLWGGTHQLRLGIELEETGYRREVTRLPDLLISVPLAAPGLDHVRFGHDSAFSDPADATSRSVFAEDLYQPHPNVSITLGLRLDHRAIDTVGHTPFDPVADLARFTELGEGLVGAERDALAAQIFTGYEGIDALVASIGATLDESLDCAGTCEGLPAQTRRAETVSFRDTSLSPMLSLSWDPWGRSKSRFSFSARRYHGEIPIELPLIESEPATADLEVTLAADGLQASSFVVAPNVLVVDRDLRTPYQDEWTLGFEHEVAAETALAVRYVNRHFRRQLRYLQLNHIPGEDGSPVLQNPFWGDVVQLGSHGVAEHGAWVLELTRRQYRSWEMHGSYTFSRTRGDGDGFDLLFADEGGQLPDVWAWQSNDRRHAFKLSSTVITPWGFQLAGVASWQSGLAYSDLGRQVGPAEIPQVLEGIAEPTPRRTFRYVSDRNGRRNAALLNVDLRLEKPIVAGRGVQLRIGLDVFNVFDDRTRVVYNPLRDRGRTIDGAQDARRRFGRRYQVGLSIDF